MNLTRRPLTISYLLAAALLAACSQGNVIARSTAALTEGNGVSLNGVSLNGVSLNGVSLNGVSLNGVSLNGVSLNGVSLNGVSLNGSELVGVKSGNTYSGTAMVGSTFSGQLSSGGTLPMRVDSATHSSGIWYYGISAYADGGWSSLCGGAGAVAFAGRWNYDFGQTGGGSWIDDASAFTLACDGSNLVKCAQIGYKPWAAQSGVLLRDHHLSCIRMMRADYCGKGTSYTVDGTVINLYDGLGVQVDTESWDREAEWTPDGARCVENKSERGGYTPSCVNSIPDCSYSIVWYSASNPTRARLRSECHNCDRD